jgi:hypothetical protein
MANLFIGGTREFDALVYNQKHPGTVDYLAQQVERLPFISQQLTDAGRQFFSTAQQLYDEFNSAEALRLARAALRKAGSTFQSNTIRSCFDVGAMQTAPLVMQRFIMAEPLVRQMYVDQRCDGYADTYVDVHPGEIGRSHYDYRRVMDGMVVDGGEEADWKATMFIEDLLEGDRELAADEKVDILNTWDMVRALMEAGDDDPTSPTAGRL